MRDHGYLMLDLSQEKARASFHFVETNRERTEKMKPSVAFEVMSGEVKLRKLE